MIKHTVIQITTKFSLALVSQTELVRQSSRPKALCARSRTSSAFYIGRDGSCVCMCYRRARTRAR
ncbi:hypothetical protein SlsnVgp005 [Spodoptera littoralis nucleopolyhedrovirus]|uniref:Uncharacterized protein n=1 Tax=Spodoptera littoralis nuclear polyhedrosis virus TaxID=10456 RepID=M1JT99_NPVSL|nr:hypothetical protein SlsnVgp005 [Spodoptera littoralis nucleopolyhedrovirus]AGE89860.1 hypothetical protein SlsnVgp005 [Spodoptera littoralis nucleopolyhedrovirus]AYU75198.1 hypothetical protein [Spodoptera littoralis nucleopolyhedrovirus]